MYNLNNGYLELPNANVGDAKSLYAKIRDGNLSSQRIVLD